MSNRDLTLQSSNVTKLTIRVADGTVSVRRTGESDGRDRFLVRIEAPGIDYECDDLCSGVGGCSLCEAARVSLSFLDACAESYGHQLRTGVAGDNIDLFPLNVAEWAHSHQDELESAYIDMEDES